MFVAANHYSPKGTSFSVVRYGNVFGSRGSVVPLFKECRKKGVVPITDERMTRFWITLEQGVHFVLKSLEEMKGGEIFVPKLPSIRISDLAKAICPNCKHKVVGIRPGEKLHETLVCKDEGPYTWEHADRYVVTPHLETSLKAMKIKGGKVIGSDFEGYTSDGNSWVLSIPQLKKLVASQK